MDLMVVLTFHNNRSISERYFLSLSCLLVVSFVFLFLPFLMIYKALGEAERRNL